MPQPRLYSTLERDTHIAPWICPFTFHVSRFAAYILNRRKQKEIVHDEEKSDKSGAFLSDSGGNNGVCGGQVAIHRAEDL